MNAMPNGQWLLGEDIEPRTRQAAAAQLVYQSCFVHDAATRRVHEYAVDFIRPEPSRIEQVFSRRSVGNVQRDDVGGCQEIVERRPGHSELDARTGPGMRRRV